MADPINLNKLYIQTFMDGNGGLLGSILSSLQVEVVDAIPFIACVNENKLELHRERFGSLSAEHQQSVLLHELWHIALLHIPRGIGKHANVWNRACDVRINNDLVAGGYILPPEGWFDPDVDEPDKQSEEALYELYLQETPHEERGECNQHGQQQVEQAIQRVQQAVMTATCGVSKADAVTQYIRSWLDKLLHKTLPWYVILQEHLQPRLDTEPVWTVPNRRYMASGLYMPSIMREYNTLEKLAVYIDTSSSVDEEELALISCHLNSLISTLNIKQCMVYPFTTSIQQGFLLQPGNTLQNLQGYGGTRLQCVVNHMANTAANPCDAALVFSDLADYPPEEPNQKLPPLFWIQTACKQESCQPSFGKVILL